MHIPLEIVHIGAKIPLDPAFISPSVFGRREVCYTHARKTRLDGKSFYFSRDLCGSDHIILIIAITGLRFYIFSTVSIPSRFSDVLITREVIRHRLRRPERTGSGD